MNLRDEVLKKIDYQKFYSSHLDDLGEPNDQGECQARCPFHLDNSPSLSVNTKTGLFHCFGCDAKGDIFSFYQKKNKIDFRTAVESLAKDLGINGNGKGLGELLKTYDYKNPDGKLLFQMCRFENKEFRQRQPGGHDGWIWHIKGLEPVPYNLPEILKADTIYVCEGEKDADTLTDLGLCATTNSNGAGNWRKELNQYFEGKNIVILPDNDQAGKNHAEDVARNLANYAKTIKIVNLPDLPPKGDASDFIEKGSTTNRQKMRLLLNVKNTPLWEPSAILEPEPVGLSCLEANDLLRMEYPAIQEVIGRGILPEGCGLLLAGEAKTGKSLLSLEWAIHLALGTPMFDGLIPIPKKRRVVFFQVENPERQIQFRLSKMLEGLSVSNLPDSIYFADRKFRYNLLDPECIKEMVQVIGRCGADIFIIDPLSSFHLVNENDNVLMRNVLDMITSISVQTGAASIVIHHFGKPNKDQTEKDRTRGASSIQGWYDGHCTLVNKKHENKVLRTVTFAPLRHGKELKPILIERDDNFLSHVTEADSMITPKDVQSIIEQNFDGTADTKVKLIQALITAFDCSQSTAIRAITNSIEMGNVIKFPGKGKSVIYKSTV
ncbi:MAG TPA: AAA family ATPase [Desulfobacteraceae bacterium]|nr:AAA family ATPase [Desulfobacteraceae bacterium]